jgi:hypothetical protein
LRFFFRLGYPDPTSQFGTMRVTSGQCHFAVNQNQRQCFRTGTFQTGESLFLRKLLWASLPNKRQKLRDR